FIGVNPDDSLEKTNKKFIKRFQYIEQEANKINKQLSDMTLEEMEVFWQQSKSK
ncbi:MAG: nucleoside triphosphate pyrophosphohydrolase, partial [Bacteroidia bacterium]